MKGAGVLLKPGTSGEWRTPRWLFDWANARYGPFTVDAAATTQNALCLRFWTETEDGRVQPWQHERVWCNPPYGPGVAQWLHSAILASALGPDTSCAVVLLPARTDTRWFHDSVLWYATQVWFIKGRLTFGGAPGPAPFPSMLVVYDGRLGSRGYFRLEQPTRKRP